MSKYQYLDSLLLERIQCSDGVKFLSLVDDRSILAEARRFNQEIPKQVVHERLQALRLRRLIRFVPSIWVPAKEQR